MKTKDGIIKLNLGSGNEYKVGWVNIDINPKWKPDILCDIEDRIPLEDNSVDFVLIQHVLEHVHPEKFRFVMGEIHRVCKNGARIVIYAPYFSCSITYKTIEHLSHMSYYTFGGVPGFDVISKRFFFFRESFGYRSKLATKIAPIINPILSFFPNILPLFYERFLCWIFPMEELKFVLKVKK